jgi:beta-glucosidase
MKLLSIAVPLSVIAQTERSWDDAYALAKTTLSTLSFQDQINLVSGIGWQTGACVGNAAVASDKFQLSLCLQDSPTGIRFGQNSSAFPASINLAATFDRDLFLQHGTAMGAEFRGKGINVALGPMMNILRAPAGGRNWEGQGADPYLAAESARLQVRGVQSQGVMATAKHWIGNEQERSRNSTSSQIDDRTLHEIYVKPFKACVEEGVAAIMCAYNLINQTNACDNDHVINTILKGQLGFRGFVMT